MASFGEEIRSRLQQLRIGIRKVDDTSREDAGEKHNASLHISKYRLRELEQNGDDIRVAELAELARLCNTSFSNMLDRYLSYHPELLSNSETPSSTQLLPQQTDAFSSSLAPAGGMTGLLQVIPRSPESSTPFWRTGSYILHGRIGLDDRTMWPMVPPGSIVRINTRQKSIAPRGSWRNDYDRPIYFLEIRNGFACGWCDLCDRQLILTPHFLSPAASRSWIMGREVEIRGRVVGYLVDHELTAVDDVPASRPTVTPDARKSQVAVLNSKRDEQSFDGNGSQLPREKRG